MVTAGSISNDYSLFSLLSSIAKRHPESVAITALEQPPLTFFELLNQIERLAHSLNTAGIGVNDRVAIVLPNGPELAVTFLLTATCATSAPLNPALSLSEFEFYLSDLNAKGLVVLSGMDSPARLAAANRGIPVFEIVTDDSSPGSFSIKGQAKSGKMKSEYSSPDDVAVILYTSGTTSTPKRVPLLNRTICNVAKSIYDSLQLTEKDRCLNIMPMFHVHGTIIGLLSSLLSGGSVICSPPFDPALFFTLLKKLKPTWYTAAPSLHHAILDQADEHRDVITGNPLRLIRTSAAFMPIPLLNRLEQVFSCPVIEGYGMTECSQIAINPLPPLQRKVGSVGIPSGPEVTILNGEGRFVKSGSIGEIAIRGKERVSQSYEKNPKNNKKSFYRDWLKTGDLGYIDADGYLFLTGRSKEVINRGSEKISPREIDEVILAHPAVSNAVTFAVPHSRLGEDLAAAVVLRKESIVTPEEIRRFVASKLAYFKVPTQIFFLEDIPNSPAGKLQRIGLARKLNLAEAKPSLLQDGDPVLQDKLSAVWKEVLKRKTLSINDNFFQLGGDSLLATQVISRIHAHFQIRVPLSNFFEMPTIAELSKFLQNKILNRSEGDTVREVDQPNKVEPSLQVAPAKQFFHEQPKMSKAMQFSIFFFSADGSGESEDKYRLLLESAQFADRNGFSAIWTPERHFHAFGGLYPNPSVLGAALAVVTKRIQIRAGSVVLPLQNPIRVAEEWAVVDNLSHGRVGIALASGWHANDFTLAPDNYADRKKVMFEKWEIVEKLWRGEELLLRNGLGKEIPTRIFPKPIQFKIPLWLASHSDESFLKAGELGANILTTLWNLNTSVENIARQIILYRKALSEHGHDPNLGTVTLMLHTFIGDSMDMVREKVQSAYADYVLVNLGLHKNQIEGSNSSFDMSDQDKALIVSNATKRMIDSRGLIGTLTECKATIDQLRTIGVDEIACLIDFGIDLDSVMMSLRQVDRLKAWCIEVDSKRMTG